MIELSVNPKRHSRIREVWQQDQIRFCLGQVRVAIDDGDEPELVGAVEEAETVVEELCGAVQLSRR